MFVAPDAPIPTKETVASCLAALSTVQDENSRFHVREYTRLLNNIMEQVTKV
jgi:ribosomal protein S10